ncbi:ferric reductase-like transmembrane domain-containing protein [Actinoplanes sp. NEAU-A12]|uniref:Ferric reductase-like transmembrane domain-containing protein n=1 Tax=Actinoplanes sandaracinus TaxID=3045177 RepID=A0ABT6WK41_9ACTN|nr:ferric reductase-like transmembrane domain-containing protein [Actinoplanes sandaracinus]MDI6100083.1 ferric reductase-like transmembrane domain-containing protein [Actinoplanes sandaracinus]
MTATAAPEVRERLRATPAWWPGAGAAAAASSLLVVTALWAGNGGFGDLTGDPLTATGRLAGLYASDLLLLQVLLMARIPLVERAFGQDRLARWHRWTGFTSFWLMALHIVTITAGYAAGANVVTELWELVWTYPGMLLAAAGTLALLTVVATSMRAARRKLRYESWHLLHLYAYLGAGLALPHQIWTGSDFTGTAWARAYWWTLYLAAAGAVLAYRIGLPVWRNRKHRLTVSRVVAEGPGLTSVYLTGERLAELPVRAGQFFQWRFLDGPGWTRANPFSLSATPRGDALRITVKNQGDGSSRMAALKPGTRVLIEGPYGKLTGESYAGEPVVMLACGVGITPLLSLLGELPYRDGEATLVHRARTDAEGVFRGELEWFAARRGVRVVHLTGPRARAASWLPGGLAATGDAEALRQAAPRIAASRVYICGPEEWARAARAAAIAAGVRPDRVHTELFAW